MTDKITLYLMSYKGYYVLQKLLSEFEPSIIDKVISAKDNKVENDYFEEIKGFSTLNGIQFFEKNASFTIDTEYVFAISWKWLIKINKRLIILHDSILPQYRGFCPLVNSLINHEKFIGVTAIFADEEYDRGDIIEMRKTKLKYPIKIFEAIEIITPLYYEILKRIIFKIINNQPLMAFKQKETDASYSLWRDEEDYKIDWGKDASAIKRFIDAVGFPYLGAFCYMGSIKVRITEAEKIDDVSIENRTPGKVIFIKNGNPVIVCGKGLLLIKKIKDDISGKSILPINKIRIRFS